MQGPFDHDDEAVGRVVLCHYQLPCSMFVDGGRGREALQGLRRAVAEVRRFPQRLQRCDGLFGFVGALEEPRWRER